MSFTPTYFEELQVKKKTLQKFNFWLLSLFLYLPLHKKSKLIAHNQRNTPSFINTDHLPEFRIFHCNYTNFYFWRFEING